MISAVFCYHMEPLSRVCNDDGHWPINDRERVVNNLIKVTLEGWLELC